MGSGWAPGSASPTCQLARVCLGLGRFLGRLHYALELLFGYGQLRHFVRLSFGKMCMNNHLLKHRLAASKFVNLKLVFS